jgi:predicted TIM-barrel fold metal-dependent hydrolase
MGEKVVLIVDSQVHIWENAKLGAHHRQVSTYSKDDLLKEMDEGGVDAALICPPASLESVNELGLKAAAQHPDRLAVMGWFQLDDPANRERIETWKNIPHMHGLRWALNQPHQQAWWTDGTMEWLWPAAEEQGLPVGFLVGPHMDYMARVAERHPRLRLLVDHLGRPTGKKDAEAFANLPDMLALAKYPNVAIKISGAPSYSSDPYPYRNIHPYIRQIFDAFGPTRTFWGTDITRMPCSYRQCVTMYTEEMPWLSGRDLELVMGRALCDWIGWDLKR